MSNVINLGWEPLQFVMRDIPEEFKHLPFTDEMNQLLLSALSSGELVQNNYYGIDSNYYRTRYGNPENLTPSPACPPSSTNTYSQSSSQTVTSTPPISTSSSSSSNQLSPTQAKTMAPKIQPPSIQLPTTQMPVSSNQLSPKYMQSQMQHAQMHNLSKSNQTQPQMQQHQLQPQMLQSQQLLQQQQISQAQMSQSQIQQQISQAQLAQMSQSQLGQQIQPQSQQTQNRYTTKSPVPPAQSQLHPPLQQQQLQQMQLQNQIQANQETTRLPAQLLQHLQQQRQQVAQVNNQPSPPQNQSRSPSPTPPSPETVAQPPPRQNVHPLMQQQLSYAQPVVHSQFNVTPQMLPAHLSNPHLLSQMQQYQQLSTLQQMQQAQVPQVQPAQQSAQTHKPSQPQHATPQVQPQPQQSQSQPQSQVNQSPPQSQVQVQSQSPQSQSQAPSQSQQQPQFLRTVSISPSVPLEPLSPTVYQFVNVKDEQDPTKSKPLTEKQKNRRRASQNLASRNYRQRKKEYITTMEDRTQDLERQAEQLRRQLNQKEVVISKLAKENAELRLQANLEAKNHEEDLEDIDGPIDANMQDIILKLERTVKLETIETNEDAERTGLNATLKAFYGSLQDRHERYTQQVKEIVNPCTQAKLSALDSDPTSPFDNGFTENDDAWWKAFSAEAEIDEEQTNKIKEVRRDHFIEFQRLRTERRDLNKEIRSYYKMVFSSAIGGAEELEADTRMEELVEKLTSLKQNLDDEKRLILQTHGAMAKILSPRQEAILVTQSYNKVVRSNAAIQMVTNMYEVVLKENALAKCCAPGWEIL